MQIYDWVETIQPNDQAGGYPIIFFTPTAFGATKNCVIKKFSVLTTGNGSYLPSVPVYAKIIDPDNTQTAMTVSQAVTITQTNVFYEFVFQTDATLTYNKQYRLVFYTGAADGSPQVAVGVRLAVMSTAQDIYYGQVGDIHGATWRPIMKATYAVAGDGLLLNAWDGWNFKDMVGGYTGPTGPRGEPGDPGGAGATGPTGGGVTGPMGVIGPMVAGAKGAPASTAYTEAVFEQGVVTKQFVYNGGPTSTNFYYSFFGDFLFSEGSFQVTLEYRDFGTYQRWLANSEVYLVHDPFRALVTANDKAMSPTGFTILMSTEPLGSVNNILIYLNVDTGELQVRTVRYPDQTETYAGSIYPAAEFSPPRNYTNRLVDSNPTTGHSQAIATSGGVASAYCQLIDKLATKFPTQMSAATVAQMKALFGA